MKRVEVNKDLVRLSFTAFTRWHKQFMPKDDMTAGERYASIGGKLPKAKKSEGAE